MTALTFLAALALALPLRIEAAEPARQPAAPAREAASGAEAGGRGAGAVRELTPEDVSYTYAIGRFLPRFVPPAPGSYELPAIDVVSDHPLVDASGNATRLLRLVGGRLAVVAFVYGTCSEAAGCPLSNAVLHQLDGRLSAEPALAKDVALVTVSFDPERDTPARLAEMQSMRARGSTWQFVTAPDREALAALLDDFGQTIAKLHYPDGSWTGVYRHVLKVYLLDRTQKVRNIYSVGFLSPDLVLGDLRTLLAAEGRDAKVVSAPTR